LLVAELSARFINIPAVEVDAAIVDALRRIVLLLDADRGQLVDTMRAEVTHSWAVEGVPAVPRKLVGELYPWVFGRVSRGESIVIPRVGDLPPEAHADMASFGRAGVKSNLTVPMIFAGRVDGALTFGCLREEREWPAGIVARARLLAEVFANALAHKRAQETLDEAMRFERLLSNVLGSLITATRQEHDAVIRAGLGMAARTIGAERATLWSRVRDSTGFVKTHRWTPDDEAAVAPTLVDIPWISDELVAGRIVRLVRLSDLPAVAVADAHALRELGIRSGVIVPLAVTGGVAGALSFASTSHEREWPDSLVSRIKHLGEVFAATLARDAAEEREREAKALAIHAERVGALGAFTASLAHELSQPLSAIESNAETATRILESPEPDMPELRAVLDDILADERRATALIQKLRVYLRKGREERRMLDLHAAVDEAVRFVRSTALDKQVDLALEIPRGLSIAGDAVQIQQVVVNLLLNAFDAVIAKPPGGRFVAVTVRREGSTAVIEVRDSGIGMGPTTLSKIFEPFFTTKAAGMGLGLSISRSIAEGHGGALKAVSTEGLGTTLRLELPIAGEA
jgi:signal transduction histidine kinase